MLACLLHAACLPTLIDQTVLSFIPLNFPHTVDVYFDMAGNAGGSGYSYDVAFSMLLGAQINSPRFGSTGEFKAFGPWEQANGAAFYPGT